MDLILFCINISVGSLIVHNHFVIIYKVEWIRFNLIWTVFNFNDWGFLLIWIDMVILTFFFGQFWHRINTFPSILTVRNAELEIEIKTLKQFFLKVVSFDHSKVFNWLWTNLESQTCFFRSIWKIKYLRSTNSFRSEHGFIEFVVDWTKRVFIYRSSLF